MKNLYQYFIFIFIISLCCISCTVSHTEHKGTAIRVFMHEPGLYSVMQDDFSIVSFREVPSKNSRLVADVPKGQSMWWEAKKVYQSGGYNGWSNVTIHIRGPEDINGGDWQQGAGGAKRQVGTRIVE